MGGLKKLIPITYSTFLLGALAISGFPLLSGFFSKDEILAHAFEQNIVLWIILSLSSLLTAFYMFRLVYLTFFNDFRGTEETKSHVHESPWTMTYPLIALCVLSVFGGVIGLPAFITANHWLANYLSGVTAPSSAFVHHGEISHGTEILLMSIAGIGAIIIILVARYKYVSRKHMPADEAAMKTVEKLVYNKFYVDEIYDVLISKPVFKLSKWFGSVVDKNIVDGFVNLTVDIIGVAGRTLRFAQSGNTGSYVFAMVIGIIVFFIIRLMI